MIDEEKWRKLLLYPQGNAFRWAGPLRAPACRGRRRSTAPRTLSSPTAWGFAAESIVAVRPVRVAQPRGGPGQSSRHHRRHRHSHRTSGCLGRLAGAIPGPVAATASLPLETASVTASLPALAPLNGGQGVGLLRRLHSGHRADLLVGMHGPQPVGADRQNPGVGFLIIPKQISKLGREPLQKQKQKNLFASWPLGHNSSMLARSSDGFLSPRSPIW